MGLYQPSIMSFLDSAIVFTRILAIGVGATLLADLWAVARRRWLGVPTLDYALLGRWVAYMPQGRWAHAPIAAAAPRSHETAVGWSVHFVTGMAFAAGLVLWQGQAWLTAPTPLPALVFGLATVVFPWGVMQPAMGAGWAASRTPHPWRARLHSLVLHAVFGLGLYASALLLVSW